MSYLRNFKPCVFAVAILVAALVSTSPALAQSVSAQINEMNVKWVAAFKQRDFAAIEALYTSNGLLLPSKSPPVEGPKAIVEVWKSWSELLNVDIAFGAIRVEASSSGDMAYDYGWYTFAFDSDNSRVMDKGKYIVVWKKVGGAWKVTAHIFNSNLPAATHHVAAAEPCAADNRARVAANDECLVIRTYGESAERTSLIIFIHGDGYRGGPSDYMYPIVQKFGTKGVVAVGLIRPGYFDSTYNRSTGNSYRKWDNYQPDVIATVAAAVKVLKNHYKAEYVVLAGHSGGSAISGIIIGKYPGLVDAAVLGACPCNVPDWRTMRRGSNNWPLSLSPHDFIGKIDKKTTVVAVTGGNDGNTEPVLARDYVASLKGKGIDATYIEVPGVGHNGIERTHDYETAINQFLKGRS